MKTDQLFNCKSVHVCVTAALVIASSSAWGVTKVLMGTGDVDWNRDNASIWYNLGDTSKTPTTFGYYPGGVLISSADYTGSYLYITGGVGAQGDASESGDVTFDLDQDVVVNQNGSAGLNSVKGTIFKKGSGQLTFLGWRDGKNGFGNVNSADWYVSGGTLCAVGMGWKSITTIGSAYKDPFTVTVTNANLICYGRPVAGMSSFTKEAEVDEVRMSVRVEKGGVARFGRYDNEAPIVYHGSSISSREAQTIRSLTLAGGQLALGINQSGVAGSNLDAALKILDKLAFTAEATEPYVFERPVSGGKIVFAGTKPVEICVEDITRDAAVDVTYRHPIYENSAEGLGTEIHKTGNGTLLLAYQSNTMSKDFHIDGGTVVCGEGSAQYDASRTYLGSRTVARTVFIGDGGTLELPNRYSFAGDLSSNYAVTKPSISLKIDKGGRLFQSAVDLTGGNGPVSCDSFGDIWLNGGSLETKGYMYGVGLHVVGTLKLTGDTPYFFEASTTNRNSFQLNGSPKTVFEIGDITGDGLPDATFERSFVVPYYVCDDSKLNTRFRFAPRDGESYGFKKRGAGTMRLTYNDYHYAAYGYGCPTGDIDVEEGVLQIDNVELAEAGCAMPVLVSAGAAVSGTGRVDRVTLAEGSGLAAVAGQSDPLRVVKPLSLPVNGKVCLSNAAGLEGRAFKARVVTSESGITGGENLANWQVYVDGELRGDVALRLRNGVVTAGCQTGSLVIVR